MPEPGPDGLSKKGVATQMAISDYEMVIGLEVHAELSTETKIFCGCPTRFGAPPNTQCCPVCMGLPGSLPVLNEKVVRLAVKAGLAMNCTIAPLSRQDRKNYFYPDLPKAYQISQYDRPLCENGWLIVETPQGEKRVGITRIHIEEDAGKLVHMEGKGTGIDCNRCGVPLIEIVSEPDMRSAAEARAYLQKLRAILLYTGVSDVRMNEGSLRCDVNLSVRRRGEQRLGERCEIKNLNSFLHVEKAIAYEFSRQAALLEEGEAILQQTRRFEPASGKTSPMRSKENADDYRYFPEPDLPPIEVTEKVLALLEKEIPVLPDARKARYRQCWQLPSYTAGRIVENRAAADLFEAAAENCRYPLLAANLLLSALLPKLTGEEEKILIAPAHLAALADMQGEGRLNSGTARRLLERIFEQDEDPAALAEREGLFQLSDETELRVLAQRVIEENAPAAADYRRGKTAALSSLMGALMRRSAGRANPQRMQEILKELL
jgi:aspartyl-tRNA(Asn)/glutamyl-tRNA(Gln) amidotransferase subunit B